MKRKDSRNFLDLTLEKNSDFRTETNESGEVTIFVENKGFFNLVMQKLLNKPRFSQVHLEEFGSFVWPLIDGKKTIYEIGEIVGGHFHDELNPLYPRLSKYFGMLKNCGFVELK